MALKKSHDGSTFHYCDEKKSFRSQVQSPTTLSVRGKKAHLRVSELFHAQGMRDSKLVTIQVRIWYCPFCGEKL